MNDLEQGLRELFETKAADASFPSRPAPAVLRRARRHQVRSAIVAVLGVAAIVVGGIAGLRAIERADTGPVPAEELGERTMLPFASIRPPEGWYLMDLNGVRDGQLALQVTNFDPGLLAMECGADSLPTGGVLLSVRQAVVEWTGTPTPWPVELEPQDGGCPGELGARWSEAGRDFVARAAFADDATETDRRAIADAFASLEVAPAAQRLTEPLEGAPALVLDTMISPVGPAVLYLYEDDCCVSSGGGRYWLGTVGPAGSDLGGGSQIGDPVPHFDEDVGLSFFEWGAFVSGDVAASVSRMEIHAENAGTYEATLVPLPNGLGIERLQAVWGFVDQPTENVVNAVYDEHGELIPGVAYPIGEQVTIARGPTWDGGRWWVFVQPSNQGLAYGYDSNGPSGGFGGSYGCCLEPLEGELRVFNASGSGRPGNPNPSVIMAFVSKDVARLVFRWDDGITTEGSIEPVSDESFGVAQVAILFVPPPTDAGQETGVLIAYDAAGNVLARERVFLPSI